MGPADDVAAPHGAFPRTGYAWYVAALLTVIYILGYVDRFILSLLIQPIKTTLGLNDFQIGLLIGPAFIILYVFFGVPFGWLADRANRRITVTVAVSFWSVMTALCGLAHSFLALFVVRVGTGVGEAALGPNAMSLIGDYFPKALRPRAIALFISAAPIGAGATYIIGGQVVQMINAAPPLTLPIVGTLYSWQTAFLVVGAPGLLFALLFFLTVREPIRSDRAVGGAPLPIGQAARYFGARWRAYLGIALGACGNTLIGGASFWSPALFERTWGWHVGKAGAALGLVLLLVGLAFTNLAGWLSARGIRRGIPHASYLVCFSGMAIAMPFLVFYSLMPTPELGLMMFALGFVGLSLATGTTLTSTIMITPARLRGQATALLFLFISLFGAQVGPVLVGVITDALGGPDQLRYAWTIVTSVAFVLTLMGMGWGLRHYSTEAALMQNTD